MENGLSSRGKAADCQQSSGIEAHDSGLSKMSRGGFYRRRSNSASPNRGTLRSDLDDRCAEARERHGRGGPDPEERGKDSWAGRLSRRGGRVSRSGDGGKPKIGEALKKRSGPFPAALRQRWTIRSVSMTVIATDGPNEFNGGRLAVPRRRYLAGSRSARRGRRHRAHRAVISAALLPALVCFAVV